MKRSIWAHSLNTLGSSRASDTAYRVLILWRLSSMKNYFMEVCSMLAIFAHLWYWYIVMVSYSSIIVPNIIPPIVTKYSTFQAFSDINALTKFDLSIKTWGHYWNTLGYTSVPIAAYQVSVTPQYGPMATTSRTNCHRGSKLNVDLDEMSVTFDLRRRTYTVQ